MRIGRLILEPLPAQPQLKRKAMKLVKRVSHQMTPYTPTPADVLGVNVDGHVRLALFVKLCKYYAHYGRTIQVLRACFAAWTKHTKSSCISRIYTEISCPNDWRRPLTNLTNGTWQHSNHKQEFAENMQILATQRR